MRQPALAATLAALLAAACTPAGDSGPDTGGYNCELCDSHGSTPLNITVAFDGSRSISMWRDSMTFARQIQAETGKTLHYSYFINSPYYLTDPPRNALGITRGEIPADEALRRWAYTQLAINEGHEVGSHLVGHYNGSEWSIDRWREEFDMFDEHTRNRLFEPRLRSDGTPLFPQWTCNDPLAVECDPVYPLRDEDGTLLFDEEGHASPEAIASGRLVPYVMVGVRAPELGWNNAMLDVMAERGFRYDTSQVGHREWPDRTRGGLWEFPVQMFPRIRSSRSILGMDYNLYVGEVDGSETRDMYDLVVEESYEGDRHPVFFCHHFSRWRGPDGLTYWDALKGAVRAAAQREDVRFPSYVELADLFDAGIERPVVPFVGTPCTSHDECAPIDGGFCVTHHEGQAGFCSVSCDRYCPDRSGYATTFCVETLNLVGVGLTDDDLSTLPAGICLSQSEHANSYCEDVPGTLPSRLPRYSDPSRMAEVCAPTLS